MTSTSNITILIHIVNSTISKSNSPANYSAKAMLQKYTKLPQKQKFKHQILKMSVRLSLWHIRSKELPKKKKNLIWQWMQNKKHWGKYKLTKEVCKWILSTKEFPEDILWIAECESSKVVIIKVSSSSSCPNDEKSGRFKHSIFAYYLYTYIYSKLRINKRTKHHIIKIHCRM